MSGTVLSEEERWRNLTGDLFLTAIYQGRVAYCLMSVYVVNPSVLNSLLNYDAFPYLWANMIYGIAVMIYSRPSLQVIVPFNRLTFGVLGSLMFNHSSMICFRWLSTIYPDRPYILAIMTFLGGRIMMLHLLAFLYHLDSRSIILRSSISRDHMLETMYL